ncbi:MAG: hypothetical protein M1832_000840 [Thelocarpon impressellum]|nr:MAG: hypothetical protein M1832_000840 [Thelocarpon impressellum]
MGWFWEASSNASPSSQSSSSNKNDPLRNLDPALRAFLERESPVKYSSPTTPLSPTNAEQPQRTYSDQITSPTTSSPLSSASAPASPPQSLYPDGRYAHLWRTYQSIADVESASKTEQEKLLDVLDGFKHRKAEIGRAALENCALEQCAVNECFQSGGWAKRMSLCRQENRELERCYLLQSKFLKALGYLSTFDRPPEVDERIQMHADTLYHRMLAQERAVEAAEAAGQPAPSFPPLIDSPSALPTPDSSVESTKDERDERDAKPDERALTALASAADKAATSHYVAALTERFSAAEDARRERRESGRETVGDRFRGWFGG